MSLTETYKHLITPPTPPTEKKHLLQYRTCEKVENIIREMCGLG